MIRSRLRGMKPGRGVAAGQDILLDAEGGNIKAVDHVLRSQDHLHVAAHGHVQFVDLALAFFVLQLPHPLLGHDVDFGRAPRRSPLLEVDHRAPHEDHDENKQRNHRPGNFQRGRAFDLFRCDSPAAAIPDGEHHDHGEDGHAHHRRQNDQKNKERVYAPGRGRGSCGPKWKSVEHSQSSVVSPRSSALRVWADSLVRRL